MIENKQQRPMLIATFFAVFDGLHRQRRPFPRSGNGRYEVNSNDNGKSIRAGAMPSYRQAGRRYEKLRAQAILRSCDGQAYATNPRVGV
jgi:hypothetical protein